MDFSSNFFKLIVKTNMPSTELVGYSKDKNAYLMNVSAEAREGKANLEILKFFRKKFKENVKIISGFKSKEKIVKIID